jgi:AP-1-like transcription factor
MDDQYDSTSPITENGNIGLDSHVAHVSCGMCTSSIDCICRELGIGAPMDPLPNEDEDTTVSMLDHRPPYPSAAAHAKLPSLSNELVMSTKDYAAQGENAPTGCSGNPRDCSACKDSEFGRAFCAALGNSVCMQNPCPTCQSMTGPSSSPESESEDTIMVPVDEPTTLPLTINPTLTQCCGDPAYCKGGACSPAGSKASSSRETIRRRNKPSSVTRVAPLTTVTTERGSDTVSCDIVWKALEAHPNAHLANPIAGPSQLANLNLLADVVARRSYCTLAPGEPTPEPEDFPRRARPRPPHPNPPHPHTHPRARQGQRRVNVMGTSDGAFDDHADARVTIAYEDEQSRDGKERERMMVPREVLQGHQRITSVPKEGMRDAIALLDQQFGCS